MRSPAPRSLSRFKRAMNRSGIPAPAFLPTGIQHALYVQPEKQKGLALIELLLLAGVIMAGTAVVFGMYSSVTAKNKTRGEATELQQLTRNVLNSYSAQSDFGSLNTTSALNDGLFPKRMVNGSNSAQSSWGNEITISSVDIEQNGETLDNWGFSINYANVPEATCVDLVGVAGAGFAQVKIEGTNVRETIGIDVNQTAELCSRSGGADLSFVYTKPGSGRTDGPLELCSPSLPPPATRTVDCEAGEYGALVQTRTAFCTTPYDPYQWTPWTTTTGGCTACPASSTETGTQWVPATGTCAAGAFGARNWEYQQTRIRPLTYDCPAGTTALPAATPGTWSPWSTTTPSITRNLVDTCATCPATATATRTVTCSPGNFGVQNQSQTTTYSCPAGTSNLPSPNIGAWTNTTSTCTACPAPSSQTQDVGCVAGQYGNTEITRPVTYDCDPATITLPAPTYGSWTNSSSTCASCPAPSSATQTQWVAASGACPVGQYGTRTWEKAQSQSRTVTYSCPANTPSLPAPIYGAWGAWSDTGATRNLVSTCVSCPSTESATRNVACPTWQTGGIIETQTRSFNCPTGTWNAWGTWATTTNTCALPACGSTVTTMAQNYMARYADLAAAFGTNYNAAYSHWYTNGYYEGRRSCWGDPCVLPTPSSQSQNQTINACPAGQYGNVTQTQSRRAVCLSPTTPYSWDAWSAWSDVSNTCAACPTAAQEAIYQWSNRNGTCPAGQSGTYTWQAQQIATRTRSYNCPAGTASLPAPSYTPYSAWADTGATQNVVNTCAPICAPTTTVVYESTSCSNSNTLEPGLRHRTAYWTCPGPTITSYGTWTVDYIPQCCPFGQDCQSQ